MKPSIEAFKEKLDEVIQGIVPKELKDAGWVYRDIPGKWSFEMWGLLLNTMGEGNYQLLIVSKDEDWIRGQFLISPKGMENLKRLKSNEALKDIS